MSLEAKLTEYKLLLELRKRQVKRSFYEFVKDSFEVINPNDKYTDNWHVKYICDVLQAEVERINRKEKKVKDIIINIPPRSLKSFICSVALPAWAWLVNPSLKFISASYSSDLSIEHNQYSRNIIESEWFKRLTDVRLADDQNTKGKFENLQKGKRQATSTGGTITGQGADIIIIDDPINPKKAASETERKTANDFFNQTLITRLNNPEIGLFIVVMQRLHEDDLTGHLLANNPTQYKHICIPAELTEDVKPESLTNRYTDGLFFPDRFTQEYLNSLKVGLGSFGYSGQILQRPVPVDGGMIKLDWIESIEINRSNEIVDFYIDTAYTAKQENDGTAILAAIQRDNNLIILDCVSVRLEFPELVTYLQTFVNKNGYSIQSKINIEPKASGLSIIQYLKRNTNLNIKQSPPPRDDKKTRVNSVAPLIECGRLKIKKGGWNANYLQEICNFPNAKHDDMVDVTIMALQDKLNRKGAIII